MAKYYILVKPWAVYVKEGEFFEAQGGLKSDWGRAWQPVDAESIVEARSIGEQKRAGGKPVWKR